MSTSSAPTAALVVLAGGSGTRVGGGLNKVFLPIAGRTAISWSFAAAATVPGVTALVLVARVDDLDLARRALDQDLPGLAIEIVPGGPTRHRSEQAGLDALARRVDAGDIDVVAVHDGARPLAGRALLARVIAAAAQVGGALPALPAHGLLRVSADGALMPGPSRDLVRVQTPQAFRARDLLAAFAAAEAAGREGTDTASTVEAFSNLAICAVPGSASNLKITYPDDVGVAERLLATHPA